MLSLAGLLALVACGGGASPSLTATPSDVAFGEVVVGTSASRSVTLTNTGDAALTVADVLATGSGIAASGPALPLILAPGESTTIAVQFAPATSGDVGGTVSIRGDDPADPLAVVTYAARAVHGPASLTAAPALVDFGAVAVGASAAETVTLTNDSSQTVNVTSVTSTSAAASASGLALPAAVAPGASRSFELVFEPAAAGTIAGHVALRGDSSAPLAVVEFRGSGASGAPRLSASPLELAFGDVALGKFGSKSVTLTNVSADAVTIAEVVATGAGVSTSGLDLPAALAPGASATLNVTFTPVASGPESGSVTVLAAGDSEPLAVIAHDGSGVAAASPSPEVAVSSAAASVAVGISVSPTAASVPVRGTRTFTARVTGTTNTGVWWGVQEGSAGGWITAAGVYTAPATPGTYHVITRSRADTTKTAVATVTVTAAAPAPSPAGVAIAVGPTTASVPAGGTRAFAATVTGTTNTAVWWAVEEGAAGGSITPAGVYTAPATPGTYHVRTRSQADTTKTATATVTVTAAPPPVPVAVSVSPTTASLATGGTRAFTATVTGTTNAAVTWSVQEGAAGGTISAAGVYTAPATAGTYHVVARSQADATKTATATVTVTAPPPPTPPTAGTPPPPAGVVPAFPGAQGAGALSKGGRGGVVYTVNTLADTTNAGCTANNNATTCSLRDCLAKTGPRTCVFAVSGTITLGSMINIYSPYLTVAGQTAPGGGIQIRGRSMFALRAHNVVWQYTRFRRGFWPNTPSQAGDTFSVLGDVHDVIFDHNTFQWSQDENFDISGFGVPAPKRITLSWNILAEPLGTGHSTSALHGANASSVADQMIDLDWHHNLIANAGWRNILASTKGLRFVNNAVYNWGKWATKLGGGIQADIVGNLYKRGPLPAVSGYTREIEAWPRRLGSEATGTMSLYVTGNKGPNNADPAADNWASMVRETPDSNQGEIGVLSRSYQRLAPLAPTGIPISSEGVNGLQASLAAGLGPYRRLACDGTWVAARDAADSRVINDFVTGTGGRILDNETQVGGFPTLAAGTRCTDSDSDGMPDAWESAKGLNPRDAADRNGTSVRPPFTNLEAYLAGTP